MRTCHRTRTHKTVQCHWVSVIGWVETKPVDGGEFYNYSLLYKFKPVAITTTLFESKEWFHGTGHCHLHAPGCDLGACRYGATLVNKLHTISTIANQLDNNDVTWIE